MIVVETGNVFQEQKGGKKYLTTTTRERAHEEQKGGKERKTKEKKRVKQTEMRREIERCLTAAILHLAYVCLCA